MEKDYQLRLEDILGEFASYLTYEKKHPKNTAETYKKDIKIVVQTETFKDYSELVDIIEQKINSEKWDKFSLNTMHRRTAALNTLLKFLKKTGKIEEVPKLEYKKIEKIPLTAITQEEFSKLIDVIHPDKSGEYINARDEAFFTLMFYTGASPSECINLKYENLEGENGKITYVKIINKWGKIRRLEVNEETAEALKTYKTLYNESFKVKKLPSIKSGMFFKNKHGKKLNIRSIRRKFEKWTKKAGLNTEPMSLRYSYAKTQIDKGIKLKELAELMGITKSRIQRIKELLLKT